jgi:ribosomal protein S18 acetylase RimI-like enzyme
MELTLRRAATADLEWIATFRRELYAHDPEGIDEQRDAETLLHLINKPDLGWALMIDVDGEAAGYVLVTFCFSVEFAGRFALIDELYVTPDRRGGGIGSQVLKQIEQHARGAGIRAIRLEVERMNLGAWRLYRKHGFEAHDRRLMTKWLGDDDEPVT